MLLVDDDDGPARAQRAEHVRHRHVRLEVRQCQRPVVRPDAEVGVQEFEGVHDGVVGEFDALGRSRGARGEEDVREIVDVGPGCLEMRWVADDLGVGDGQGRHTAGVEHTGVLRAGDEGELDSPRLQQLACAFGGLVDPDRQVGRARGEDGEQRRNLFGVLGTQHRDDVATVHASRLERSRDREHLVLQLAVAELLAVGEHGDGIGRLPRVPEEPVDQVVAARRHGRGVERCSNRLGCFGYRGWIWGVPGRFVGGESGQLGELVGEHGLGHARREGLDADVPVDHQTVDERGGLGVDEHLWTLRDGPHRCAELVRHVAGEEVPQAECAGVDDRGQRLGAAVPADVAKHVEPRHRGVSSRGVQHLLHGARPRGGGGGVGQVDVEHQRRGEVAHQLLDIGVVRLATEHREVEQEPRIRRPVGQRVRIGRRHRHRRGDAATVRRGEQRVAGRDVENVPQPDVPARVGLLVARNQRQRGRFRQLGDAVGPPLEVLVGRSRSRRDELRAVLPIGIAESGQVRAAVERGEVGHEVAVAHRVGGLHVHVDVQARAPVREQRQRDL